MRFSETRLDNFQCTDGIGRPVHVWEPDAPKGVIMAIHGGMAHAGDYVTPALYFKERGYATLSFDMRGHCQKRVVINKFNDFVDDCERFFHWVAKQYPKLPIFIFGHSMGGLIATHMNLHRLRDEERLKGFVLSSPYYENAIKVPDWQVTASKLFSRILPSAQLPIEDFTEVLTHDKAITERHKKDCQDGIRAAEVSVRFVQELLAAQKDLDQIIAQWKYPLYAVVAGDDKLANPEATMRLLRMIKPEWVETSYQEKNYHENFNEVNREEIFNNIHQWMALKLETNND